MMTLEQIRNVMAQGFMLVVSDEREEAMFYRPNTRNRSTHFQNPSYRLVKQLAHLGQLTTVAHTADGFPRAETGWTEYR